MVKKLSKPGEIVCGILAVVLLCAVIGILLASISNRPFSGYDDDAVLRMEHPLSTRIASVYIGGGIGNDRLLYAQSLKLRGIDEIRSVKASEPTTGTLRCSFSAVDGAFKLILVSPDGAVNTLFDTQQQKNGDEFAVPFAQGENSIRLVGKPCHVKDLQLEWTELDRSFINK